ncbi:MAG: CAP domain-containing protein [Actinomycetota bacterium]|nr:CAP domain-containing protein [Actinomycetota bacterium]
MSRTADKAMVLMAVIALVVGVVQLDPLGAAGLPEQAEVVGCDGRPLRLDGEKAELLLRLHNKERAEHGAPALYPHPQLEAA